MPFDINTRLHEIQKLHKIIQFNKKEITKLKYSGVTVAYMENNKNSMLQTLSHLLELNYNLREALKKRKISYALEGGDLNILAKACHVPAKKVNDFIMKIQFAAADAKRTMRQQSSPVLK